MAPLVVGTLALDEIETPHGGASNSFGGSASFSTVAAGLFGSVRLVAAVGDDFPDDFRQLLVSHNVGLDGVVVHPGEKMFRWRGRYFEDLNRRETVEMQLNVIEKYAPIVPASCQDARVALIANMPPQRQRQVIDQFPARPFLFLDTVDDWIKLHRQELVAVLSDVDLLLINDAEVRMLAHEDNLFRAAKRVREWGPREVVVKKGEHGCVVVDADGCTALPAFPTENVVDPTGAGDSFAGGLLGYLGTQPEVTPATVRRGLAYGTVIASLTCEAFGLDRLKTATRAEVEARLAKYLAMLQAI